jgi:uncharacterized protein
MLHEQIKNEIKEAMLKRDTVRLGALRMLSAAFTNELVAKGRKPQEMLNNEEAEAVVMRLVKQRQDSITQFRNAGREELAKNEEEEMSYLQKYLPEMMSREEIEKIIKAKKEELGITDKSKAGQFMGTIMKDLKGKADGQLVKEVIDSLFS